MTRHLIAPELVIAETLNALWRALRVGQLTAAQLDAVADDLPSYFDELHPLSTYGRRASRIARDLGHPVYDCFPLALAEAQNARFVTADGRLLTRAAGHPSASRMLALTALGA